MQTQQLMERGKATLERVGSDTVELCRGMAVVSAEGTTVGHIAAVLTGDNTATLGTHVVLLMDPAAQDGAPIHYRLLPVQWITAVVDQAIYLTTPLDYLVTLPSWHQG